MATKVLDVDLADGPRDVGDLAPYERALLLVRWRRRPLGRLRLPIRDGRLCARTLEEAATAEFGAPLAAARLRDRLPIDEERKPPSPRLPSATVIVCTRDRPDDLRRCVERLRSTCPADVRILVVDDAPCDDRTAAVARALGVTYVREERPGLGWARTRGVEHVETELVLFTDDDVLVDPGWADEMRRPFGDPDVAAVTGLVMPCELETDAQELFERHCGFEYGFTPRDFDALALAPTAAGGVGAGASMAFRTELVRRLSLFAFELGAGSSGGAAEDTYAFYRLLAHGYRITYTPDAIAWHRHRADDAGLARQLRGYGTGMICFLLRCLVDHGEGGALQSFWWLVRHYGVPRLWRGLRGDPTAPPPSMTLAELRGWLDAPAAFVRSRRLERAIRSARSFA